MATAPETLVFSGGGTRCLVFGELLVHCESGGHLRSVRDVWGTSAGALLATLYALTRSAVRTRTLLFDLDFSSFRNVDVGSLLNFMNTWGVDDGTAMIAAIERLLELALPGGSRLLLRDVTGLHIVVADLTVRRTVVLSAETYPDLRVSHAIRASMSLPIFLRPYISPEGHYWVDGGVRANFPWSLLPVTARASALGFRFARVEQGAPKSLSDYILSMVHFDEAKKTVEVFDPKQVLSVPTPPYPAWFLRLRAEDYVYISELARGAYDAWMALTASEPVCALTPLGASVCPPGTSGNPPLSDPPCTPPPVFPAHHTVESSGSPPVCPAPSQGSSPHSLPRTQRISRRWSF